MRRFGFLAILSLQLAFFGVSGLSAQEAAPGFRYLATRDMDFYGEDLDALFDTDLQSCIRACSANNACNAFTFNARSNACFPKRGVSEQTPYQGALSAVKLPSPAAVRDRARQQAARLAFLPDRDLTRAVAQARDLGLRYAAGGMELDQVIAAMRNAGE
ncbi:MAG TPA: hypothetical protein DET67_17085, partial [Ruegeria sp.]|nr:hypothetical protein [Ruegeria sp.]